MKPYILTILCLLSFTLLHPSTALSRHRPPPYAATLVSKTSHAPLSSPKQPPRVEFFEVTHPIPHPPTIPCIHKVLSHDFGSTYRHPPVHATYAPPKHCHATEFSNIILEWSATCQGRQFDRIFGLWLGGVELLRSCTAEPTRGGIYWKVQKDVTKYNSLLMKSNQTLDVYIGNIVDKTYTGVYHVNVTLYYYPSVEVVQPRHNNNNNDNNSLVRNAAKVDHSELYRKRADLILPVSRDLPLSDGLWFKVENSTDFQSKGVVIPRNSYRAVLEVYVSPHENDEFWYSNVPNEYLVANNDTNLAGNGPFREVLVSLDGDVVGAIWPFTVVYTGGINPLLWRPISAIGSYDLPTYDIEITPFLGNLLDGKEHKFGFSVTNALNVWYIDANLHLWLDKSSNSTKGELLKNNARDLILSTKSDFKGSNGKFFNGARRSIVSTGWVESSYGNITTTFIQKFGYKNSMVLGNDGNLQKVNQTIDFDTIVTANVTSSAQLYKIESRKRFPLFMYTNQVDQGNSSYTYQSNVTLEFKEDYKTLGGADSEQFSSSLRNHQKGTGNMLVKGNLVQSGLGSTHQKYEYDESSGGSCYFRDVKSYNYTILHDKVSERCE